MMIKVNEITLLSIDEYKKSKQNISLIKDVAWWLRSPGYHNFTAAFVEVNGDVNESGYNVAIDYPAVRPVLKLLGASDLLIKEKLDLAGHTWTVISENLALCDDILGWTCFSNDTNAYETSDIKKYIDNWVNENGKEMITC